ncbi:hypothetical protein [Ruminococcus sp.]|uniref:hypothetical protein n=1 Tax=Ruminococcus sp. TaxID=41978 RepID=UPI00257F5F9C|nr:hypothetical protein [Ruminococcus sp.]
MINEKKVKLQKVKRILTLIFGIIFAILGVLFAFTIGVTDDVATIIEMSLILLCGGVAMIIWAKKRKKLINDMSEFMKILSCDENGCLNSISSATNRPIEEIKNEINKLIKLEFLQGVFIDESCNCLVKGNGEVNLKSRAYTSPQSSSKTESVIHEEENTNDKDASENQFDDGTILLIDNGASYNKLTKETLTFKSGKEIKEVNVSDIYNAKLGLLGVTITLKDNRQEILPTIPKDKYSVWVDAINELVQGKGNYTPLSHETIAKVKKQRKIAIGTAVAVLMLVVIGGLGIFTPDKATDNDYFEVAKILIGQELKAPTTARYYDFEIKAEDDYGRKIVFCHCDAQNGFGAYVQDTCWVLIDKVEIVDDSYKYTYSKINVIVVQGNADYLSDTYVSGMIKNESTWNQPFED